MKSIYGDGDLIDIGHGVGISFFENAEGRRVGLLEEHDRPDGQGRCAGSVQWENASGDSRPTWTLESGDDWEHLTLSPSLLCRACGHHGFVKGGRWVPA